MVDEPDLRDLIGRPRFTSETAERTAVPGVATGLAVTGMGGDVLFIEANAVKGSIAENTSLTLTGQLGDVMKESAQIALSYVRSHAAEIGIEPELLDRRFHLHVPAGGQPKDGPSAGVTMVTALVSLATGRAVRSDVAMTGEVTLNGRVLPIGGVKQKLLAAQRAGVTTVFIPARNEPDLDDVPAEVLAALTVHPVKDVAQILALALEPARCCGRRRAGGSRGLIGAAAVRCHLRRGRPTDSGRRSSHRSIWRCVLPDTRSARKFDHERSAGCGTRRTADVGNARFGLSSL